LRRAGGHISPRAKPKFSGVGHMSGRAFTDLTPIHDLPLPSVNTFSNLQHYSHA
jgi:hypothetical protein